MTEKPATGNVESFLIQNHNSLWKKIPFEMFPEICEAMEEYASLLSNDEAGSELLSRFIAEIKNEFKDQNWDYLDFIADRVLNSQPKEQPLTPDELNIAFLTWYSGMEDSKIRMAFERWKRDHLNNSK